MPRKLFTAPTAQFLTGENARPLRWILGALNEYFKKHIGFWGRYTGTTNGTGHLVITHNCGFEPEAVNVTEHYVDSAPHDMGPFHLHSFDATTIDIHFLTKSGQDRATHNVEVCVHFVPFTS